jgi:hypothetical protein
MCYSAEIMMVSLCFSLLDITLIIRYMLWGICHILAEWQIVVPLWRLVLCLCVYINIKSRHMVSNQPEVILSRYYFLCSYNLFCMVKLFLEKKKKMEQLGFLTHSQGSQWGKHWQYERWCSSFSPKMVLCTWWLCQISLTSAS